MGYNYAIYRDKWDGRDRFQAYSLAGDEPLPVAPPSFTRTAAEADAYDDWNRWGSVGKALPSIEPKLRFHQWTGNRRSL